jgi:hypothetical protein
MFNRAELVSRVLLTFERRVIGQQGDLGEVPSFDLPLRIITNCNAVNSWSVIEVSVRIFAVLIPSLVCGQ